MKATGIVRRLDDLGRLVIPKEIRKIYKLKEGDSIEFFVSDNKEIIIKKYQHLSEDFTQLENMIETYQDLFKSPLLFYGDDQFVSKHENFVSKQLTVSTIEKLKVYSEETLNNIQMFEIDNTILSITVFPLVIDSLWVGSFFISDTNPTDSMKKVIYSFIKLLSRNLNE